MHDQTRAPGTSCVTNERIRRQITDVVRTASKRFNALHVPHPSSTTAEPKPLCNDVGERYDNQSRFIEKELAIYPPAHTEGMWCTNCKEMIADSHPAWLATRHWNR